MDFASILAETPLFDWKRLDELVERGHARAPEHLAPLRETLVR